MDYYICSTGFSKIWDLDKKLVILGPWCITDAANQQLLKGRDYVYPPMTWVPAVRIKEASDYCCRIYEKLLISLSRRMNETHDEFYPGKYWRIIIGYWLFHFIMVLYDRYKRLESVFIMFPDSYTHILPESECDIHSVDTNDFFENKLNDDLYNLRLFSYVARHCHFNRTRQLDVRFEAVQSKKRCIKFSRPGVLFSGFLKTVTFSPKTRIILSEMYHFQAPDFIRLKLLSSCDSLGFINFKYLVDSARLNGYSVDLRKTIQFEGAKDSFEELLYKVLPQALPLCYLENYKIYKNREVNMPASLKLVCSSVGWYFNERFKFFAAEAAVRGAKTVEFQHGGGYGMSLVLPADILSKERDIFYSWGWDKSLPSPHLSRLKDRHLAKQDNVLFIGTGTLKYPCRLDTQLLPDHIPGYFRDKITFLQGLTASIRAKVLYRPYPNEYGWQEQSSIRQSYPDIQFLLGKNLKFWMQRVKLVVIDHAATSLLETLAINVPTILYWNHEINLMKPEADELFLLLRRAGILFDNPKDAAEKVNSVFSDPSSWWLQSTQQSARLRFCERFAFASRNWPSIWAKEFDKLLDSGD